MIRTTKLEAMRDDRRHGHQEQHRTTIGQARRCRPHCQKNKKPHAEQRRNPSPGQRQMPLRKRTQNLRKARDQGIQRHCGMRRGSLGEIFPFMMPDRAESPFLDHPNSCHARKAIPIQKINRVVEENRVPVPGERSACEHEKNNDPRALSENGKHFFQGTDFTQHLVERRRTHPTIQWETPEYCGKNIAPSWCLEVMTWEVPLPA